MTWTLTLDGHTALKNQLDRGRQGAIRLKRRDRGWVKIACYNARVPVAQGPRRVSLLVTLKPRQRAPDRDAWWWSLLDALVCCGALVDDSPRWAELGEVNYTRAKHNRMTVILEDLPPVRKTSCPSEKRRRK